jgi:hypothetical protein
MPVSARTILRPGCRSSAPEKMTAASGSSICICEHDTRTPMLPAWLAFGPLRTTVRRPPLRWNPIGIPVSSPASQSGSHASSHSGVSTRAARNIEARRPTRRRYRSSSAAILGSSMGIRPTPINRSDFVAQNSASQSL